MPHSDPPKRKPALRDDAAVLKEGAGMDFSKLDYAYALSGGIGSGKSTACKILSSLGYAIIDGDKLAHGVLDEKKGELVRVFGEGIMEGEELSREKLGAIVFGDGERLEELNGILRQRIQEKLYERCLLLEAKREPYFVELAMLFEQREHYNFSRPILVACSKDTQIWRVMRRNGWSQEDVQRRIDSQMGLEAKIPLAYTMWWNEGGVEDLEREILAWLKGLGGPKNPNFR